MKRQFQRFRLRSIAALVGFTLAAQAWAVDPFTVRDIRLEGLQRVEPGTIFASLPVRVGDQYTDEKGAAAIRSLFALGLFKDVRLEVQGSVLVVIVEERPTVAEINFSGMKEFDKDALQKALKEIGLTEGRPYDQSVADRAEQELKRQYINRSYYGVQVLTTASPAERNRVNLTFTVTEGEPAKIKELRIVGANAFSEGSLRKLFELDTGGFLTWYTKADRYARSKLTADQEALRSHYLSQGYLEFRIDSTQVAISPDKQDISITINITEGQRFAVQAVRLAGNYLGKEEEFKRLISIKVGQAYNIEQVTQTTKAMTEHFGNFGYAFAAVEVRPTIDRVNNRVVLTLAAEPGRRAYVRKVNISGNNRTRDEVIRRELRQFEASWYDGEKIKASRSRIDRLGFFKEVNVDTVDVPGAPDQVDLNVSLVEKPTGSLQMSAGFSQADKLSLSFSVKQENAFGSGNYLGVEVNTSKYNRALVLSSVNPYFTSEGVSRAIDLFYRRSIPYEDQGGNYSLGTAGAGLRFGVPFTDLDTVFFGIALDRTTIHPGTNIPAYYLAYAAKAGYTSTNFPLTVGWGRDDRDSAIAPSSGRVMRLNGELGVIGDARYVRASGQYQQFFPITKQFTWMVNGEFGWGKGLAGQTYPVFKNFYGGGLGSVRGFDQGTLGPRDVTGSTIGGPKKLVLNTEVSTPFPGAGNDKTLRGFVFADVGNVYGENEKTRLSDLRASVGVGIGWISPMGPLRIAVANPIRKFPGDRIQKIQFEVGKAF